MLSVADDIDIDVESGTVVHSWFLFFVTLFVFLWFLIFWVVLRKRQDKRAFLVSILTVPVKKTARVLVEIKRKSFHFTGCLIPVVFYLGQITSVNGRQLIPKDLAVKILLSITAAVWAGELLRKASRPFNELFVRHMSPLLRDGEHDKVTAVASFLLGCLVTIWLCPPPVALAAILNLVLGDGAAALVGLSFGKTKIFGLKKSIEGSLAMFCVCLLVNLPLLWNATRGGEVLAVAGALASTLVELRPPFGFDDNFAIPSISGLIMTATATRLAIEFPPL